MDLIYTNAAREDLGVLHDYTFDLAFGSDENNFELTVDGNNNCCEPGAFVYIEGTEYGGIVDGLKVVTKDKKLVYSGRTWHGILEKKVLKPDEGSDYLTVSGEANEVIAALLERVGLSDLFSASSDDSGLTISNYNMHRYVDAYTGITKMLESVSGKLHFEYQSGTVTLSALPIVDYSQDEQFDSDQVKMEISKQYRNVNHLVCLGTGELSERLIVHLFIDAKGNISENQNFFGLDEIEETYEYSNAKSLEELTEKGIEKLKDYASIGNVKMDFDTEQTVYDVGDIVGAKEIITGEFVKEKITKKIVTINKGQTNIEYKVGE